MLKILNKPGIASDVLKVLTGNIVAQGFAFLVTVLISRDLGPGAFGEFSLIVAIFTCITQISDFGTSTSYVRFLSQNKDLQAEALGSMLLFKIITSAFFAAAIWCLAPAISQYFFESERYTSAFKLCSTAIVFHSLLTTMIAHLQGLEQFRRYSLLSISHHGVRLMIVGAVVLCLAKGRHFDYFMYAYFFVAALIEATLLASWEIKFKLNLKHIAEIYSLGFWILLSSIAVIIQMRIDVLMLQKMASPIQTGLYSVASNVAMILPLVTMSITATLMPKMDSFLKNHTVREFIAKVGSATKYVIACCIVVELLAPFVVHFLFGSAYHDAIPVLAILLVSYMFGVIINPISLIYYQVNKAYILTIVNWGQLFIGLVANWLLISPFGAVGAAISSLLLHIFSSSVIVLYLYIVQPSVPKLAIQAN